MAYIAKGIAHATTCAVDGIDYASSVCTRNCGLNLKLAPQDQALLALNGLPEGITLEQTNKMGCNSSHSTPPQILAVKMLLIGPLGATTSCSISMQALGVHPFQT